MAETETAPEQAAPAAASKRRRTRARRPAARKSPARKKASGRARRAKTNGLAALLNDVAGRAAAAGKGLKALSGQGTDAAKKALRGASAASKKTIARLAKEWEGMDAKARARFVAALLAALAAVSAPIVRTRMKK